jgi:hypothetical protein
MHASDTSLVQPGLLTQGQTTIYLQNRFWRESMGMEVGEAGQWQAPYTQHFVRVKYK